MTQIRIADATSPEDLDDARRLIADYLAGLEVDQSFEDTGTELANLPWRYAPPRGALMLARREEDGVALGVIALRPLPGPGDCESRRLYVSPDGRGLGLGIKLGWAIIERAREIGYRRLLIDTRTSMHVAQGIYRNAGFYEVPPYYPNPAPGTVYMAMDL